MKRCWDQKNEKRPSFEEIVKVTEKHKIAQRSRNRSLDWEKEKVRIDDRRRIGAKTH